VKTVWGGEECNSARREGSVLHSEERVPGHMSRTVVGGRDWWGRKDGEVAEGSIYSCHRNGECTMA